MIHMFNALRRMFGLDRSTALSSPWADRAALQAMTVAHLTGADLEALPPTRADAMTVAAVAKGRNLIASSIAKCPLVGMRGNEVMPDAPAILVQPEAGRPRFHTITWTVDAMIFYGRAWWCVTDWSEGRPCRVQWVPEWEAVPTTDGASLTSAFGRRVDPAHVIRIDAHHEGILTYAGPRIRSAMRLDRAALTASTNPVPSVELHQVSGTPLTAEEGRKLTADYADQRRRHGVSYTNQSIETRTHGAQPENLLVDGRKAAALDIARVLGLPAWTVDASVEGTSLTYSNVPSRNRELIDYGLDPYMSAIAERLSMDDILPRGQWARFNTDALLRDDFNTRMAGYKAALEVGVYTIDQLRDRERGIPLEN
ncbi:phage portal protein, HK97 family [Actinomyces sp. oral taxon 877 str. F0543]|nr:phage portal protein, HK97 family [Actinomyces sp. oral taxon 877 str. F0543]